MMSASCTTKEYSKLYNIILNTNHIIIRLTLSFSMSSKSVMHRFYVKQQSFYYEHYLRTEKSREKEKWNETKRNEGKENLIGTMHD